MLNYSFYDLACSLVETMNGCDYLFQGASGFVILCL